MMCHVEYVLGRHIFWFQNQLAYLPRCSVCVRNISTPHSFFPSPPWHPFLMTPLQLLFRLLFVLKMLWTLKLKASHLGPRKYCHPQRFCITTSRASERNPSPTSAVTATDSFAHSTSNAGNGGSAPLPCLVLMCLAEVQTNVQHREGGYLSHSKAAEPRMTILA